MPKSVSLARIWPYAVSSRMFSGLTSRWMTPSACAAERPSATSAQIAAASAGLRTRSLSRRVRRSGPLTRSMTSARSTPSTTRSWMPTMPGWSRLTSAVRSCTNRATNTSSEARSSRRSLMATGPSGPSPAQTVPLAPRPSTFRATYRLPILRANAAPCPRLGPGSVSGLVSGHVPGASGGFPRLRTCSGLPSRLPCPKATCRNVPTRVVWGIRSGCHSLGEAICRPVSRGGSGRRRFRTRVPRPARSSAERVSDRAPRMRPAANRAPV